MILVAGIPSEPPLALVIESADRLGVKCIVLNQRNAHLYKLESMVSDEGIQFRMDIGSDSFDMKDVAGIYPRLMDYYQLPEIKDKVFNYIGSDFVEKSIVLQQLFTEYTEVTNCRVLNKSYPMLTNMSKPFQSQIIAQCGFLVPPTCITSSWDAMAEFKQEYENIIFKSISSTRSIVKQLNDDFIVHKEKIKFLPVQFQESLIGTNIRVHVVGDVLFATKVDSETVDYRYANRENKTTRLSAFDLPISVQKKCFQLSKTLELPLCGIDLFLTEDNQYYCFEVNPSPGYSYYQMNTGQDISGAIVKWLEYGTAK